MATSWVIKDKASGKIICETFSRKMVRSLDPEKHIAIPILEYLHSLNQKGPDEKN